MAQVPASAAEAERATNQPQSDPLPDGISEEDAEAALRALAVMGGLDLHSFRMPSLKRLREAIVPCAALLSDPSPWLNGSFLALLWSDEMDARAQVLSFLPLEDIGRVIPRLSKIFRDEQPVVLYRVARDVSPDVSKEALREFCSVAELFGSADKKLEDVFQGGDPMDKMKDAFNEVRGYKNEEGEQILHEAIGKFLDVVHFKGREFRVFCGDDLEAWGDAVREEITMIDEEGLRWIQITSPDHAMSQGGHIRIRHAFSEDNLCPRLVEFTIKFRNFEDGDPGGVVFAGVAIGGLGKLVVESDYYDHDAFYRMKWVANHQSLDQGFEIAIVEPDTRYTVSIVIDWDPELDYLPSGSGTPEVTVTITSPSGREGEESFIYACNPLTYIKIFDQAAAVTLISSFRLKYSERIKRDAEFGDDSDSDEYSDQYDY